MAEPSQGVSRHRADRGRKPRRPGDGGALRQRPSEGTVAGGVPRPDPRPLRVVLEDCEIHIHDGPTGPDARHGHRLRRARGDARSGGRPPGIAATGTVPGQVTLDLPDLETTLHCRAAAMYRVPSTSAISSTGRAIPTGRSSSSPPRDPRPGSPRCRSSTRAATLSRGACLRGASRGAERIAILSANRVDYVAAFMGAMRFGRDRARPGSTRSCRAPPRHRSSPIPARVWSCSTPRAKPSLTAPPCPAWPSRASTTRGPAGSRPFWTPARSRP